MRDADVVEVAMGDLVGWAGGSPVVRAEAPPTGPQPALGLRCGPAWAVAFVRVTHRRGLTLMLHADDASGELASPVAVALLEELVASTPFASWVASARAKGADSVSLPRTAEGLGELLVELGGRWEWMSTRVAPPPVGTQIVDLPEGTRPELVAFLEEHNPRTDGEPFARPAQRWVGARGADARLLGIGCCEPEPSGAPVLAGITVAPAARGLGLGRAITAELTRGAVSEHGWSTLGMYSDNDTARRLYLRLGYEIGARWSSGRLA